MHGWMHDGQSGLESIFQLVHLILTDFKWEEDALMRAKKLYGQGHDMTVNSLEGEWVRQAGTDRQTWAIIRGQEDHAQQGLALLSRS